MTKDEMRGGWIQTYTGRKFFPLDPKPEDVCVDDIAHHLALKCRFGGACKQFYSVAQHSVLVAQQVPLCLRPAALLHDAAEAYMPDFCRPVKPRFFAMFVRDVGPSLETVGDLEGRIQWAIASALSVWQPGTADGQQQIKLADNCLLATEARDLMGKPPEEWHPLPAPLVSTIEPWSSERAEHEFLKLHLMLQAKAVRE